MEQEEAEEEEEQEEDGAEDDKEKEQEKEQRQEKQAWAPTTSVENTYLLRLCIPFATAPTRNTTASKRRTRFAKITTTLAR